MPQARAHDDGAWSLEPAQGVYKALSACSSIQGPDWVHNKSWTGFRLQGSQAMPDGLQQVC